MKKYIDKSALVAEIERIKKEECPIDTYEGRCKLLWFEQFLSFLDTLEVKETNLDEEFSKWWKSERAKDYNVDILYEKYSNASKKLVKYFFELGIKTNRGEKL